MRSLNNINNRILSISSHLQTLSKPEFSKDVEEAVEKNDKTTLVKICQKAKIPNDYIGSVVSVVLSVSPMKWPEGY